MYLSSICKYLGNMGRSFAEILVDHLCYVIISISAHTRYFVIDNCDMIDVKLAQYECQGGVRSHFSCVS